MWGGILYILERRNKHTLFDEWYKTYGKVFHFIYRCNHNITDIQYRELVELLRMHCKLESLETKVHFKVRTQMENFMEKFYDEIFSNHACHEVRKACFEKMSNTIVLDNFHTTSLVYVPNGIQIDFEAIIYEAGYLLACGENVFVRNIEDTTFDDVLTSVVKYSEQEQIHPIVRVFDSETVPYADREYENDYKNNGVMGLQIDSKQFYMKNESVENAVKQINRNLDFLGSQISQDEKSTFLWLFRDFDIEYTRKSSNDNYYFLTKIFFLNKNNCYLFDTDHPAWNNMLIPHSFVTAMLNISRGSAPERKELIVLDPFVGSGTMAVESAKFHNIRFFGGDKNPNSQRQTMDNLLFFSLNSENVTFLAKLLLGYMQQKCLECYLEMHSNISKRQQKRIKQLEAKTAEEKIYLFNRIHEIERLLWENEEMLCSSDEIHEEKMNKMQKIKLLDSDETLFERIFLYIFRKAFLRHLSHDSDVALKEMRYYFFEELKTFFFRLLDMIDDLKITEACNEGGNNLTVFKDIQYVNGFYTEKQKEMFKDSILAPIDMKQFFLKWQGEKKADIIITDPPYGYNTIEEDETLYKLYCNLVENSVKSLNNGGQIIICLAAKMNQGKRLPEFIKRDFLLDLFRNAAHKNKMRIVELDEEICHMGTLYQFPFFWESKKVLRREILRLQFIKD